MEMKELEFLQNYLKNTLDPKKKEMILLREKVSMIFIPKF
jgi:hypothetical protein